jgi:type 1 glutamine amidotransferase
MKCALAFLVLLLGSASVFAQEKPLSIFIRAGQKTHGPGEHDYPQFLADWTKLLKERGALADGSLNFPRPTQLERVDVMIIYSPDGGTVNLPERKILESFIRRGGGLVVLHDGMCSNDADWFKTIVGGAKQHGVTNWSRGKLKLNFTQPEHPITKGFADFELEDELFYRLHLMPDLKVLATAVHEGEKIPQLWCYEKDTGTGSYRAFVSLQGHHYRTFSLPRYRDLVLRGIAWAGKRQPDLLIRSEAVSR